MAGADSRAAPAQLGRQKVRQEPRAGCLPLGPAEKHHHQPAHIQTGPHAGQSARLRHLKRRPCSLPTHTTSPPFCTFSQENLDLWDFALTDDEMTGFDNLPNQPKQGQNKVCPDPNKIP
jgi:hypothetical protein